MAERIIIIIIPAIQMQNTSFLWCFLLPVLLNGFTIVEVETAGGDVVSMIGSCVELIDWI